MLPFRRRSRPRGRARLAPAVGRDDTQRLDRISSDAGPGICRIHGVPRPCGICDGTSGPSAVIFEGAESPLGIRRFDFKGYSDIGLMPPGVVAIKDWGRDTQPLAWGRTETETRPDS